MKLNHLLHNEIVREIDLAFAGMVRRLDSGADSLVAVAAALVSRAANCGHVCLDLADLAHRGFQSADARAPLQLDVSLEQWLEILGASRLVGRPGETAPMVLDESRLYLQRFWKYEQQVARAILDRCRRTADAFQAGPHRDDKHTAFAHGDAMQQQAVRSAQYRNFTVISGGPGTGKTYTIARIISGLQSASGGETPRIKLAAPTGKAAARLQQALEAALAELPDPPPPIKALTLHRLLGAMIGRARYRYDADNPLPVDMVIVDEASMVDMALMAGLTQALPPTAKLVLVGDKDQLASVEAGAVLGDICSGLIHVEGHPVSCGGSGATRDPASDKDETPALPAPVVVLEKNYRFGEESGIHRLGLAVNRGDGDGAMALLDNGREQGLTYLSMDSGFDLAKSLAVVVEKVLAPIFAMDHPMDALGCLMAHKILTPVRNGPYGVQGLNLSVERILRQTGAIRPIPGADPWYAGRPVMITRNDYHHNLFNGDIGITTVKKVGASLKVRVAFADDQQGPIYFAPEQLPEHETVYAMTVHKSQGTEFDHVLMVMPDKDVPVLSRELIYTAITRARKAVTIWSRRKILKTAVQRRIRRTSGLRRALQRS